MKPIKIEEDFINLLTKIAWWFDCYHNKNVAWLSLVFTVITSFLINIFIGIDSYNTTIVYAGSFDVWFIVYIVILPTITTLAMLFARSLFLLSINHAYSTKQVIENTKKSPNPNKYTHWILTCRTSALTPIVCGALDSHTSEAFSVAVMMIVTITPSLYFLCVDSLPPGLKKKKLEEKETEKLESVTSL